jgi:hypothetical protein
MPPYFANSMVGARGFEPPTLCTPCRCATRLRYAPRMRIISEGATAPACAAQDFSSSRTLSISLRTAARLGARETRGAFVGSATSSSSRFRAPLIVKPWS